MGTLGQRIKESRESKKMLQSELASSIGVKSSAVISNWEKDINKPDADKIVSLCKVLNISASYLLDYKGAFESSLSFSENELIETFRDLNDEGQEKLFEYARLLSSSGQYKKHSESEVVEA